jgi:hypothetical protein
MMRQSSLLVLATAALMSLPAPSWATQILAVDFGQYTQAGTSPNFTYTYNSTTQSGFSGFFDALSQTAPSTGFSQAGDSITTPPPASPLATSDGSGKTITVQVSNEGGFFRRGGVSNSGSLTFANLYNSFTYKNGPNGAIVTGNSVNTNTVSLTLTLSGTDIAANTPYSLTFYSYDPLSTDGSHNVTITGGTTAASAAINYVAGANPTTDGQYSATQTYTSNASGVLALTLSDFYTNNQDTGGTGMRLNAFAISTAPEPASVTILVLGGAGLLLPRRQQLARQQQ